MSRLRGLYGDFPGGNVPNLTHHDDVRILTEEGLQGRGKVQASLRVYVYLVNAHEIDFHRVFRRGNIHRGFIENGHARI